MELVNFDPVLQWIANTPEYITHLNVRTHNYKELLLLKLGLWNSDPIQWQCCIGSQLPAHHQTILRREA